ncbi:glycosyltransferase family 2 protein [Providencia sneebia]|uniref:Glycosyl transferase family protein n=1 Tax=Providencia sneebia DSM 19967 TaxID=1141660 RepID=K8WV19_9GAMM|nr:glycosyltransferase family 2 protein [Providencia sneebia]EKT61277.1 glycosyl transferase family protein [Providencia sneebia DSM 19967]
MDSKSNTPLVSVIMPCYNSEKNIQESIDSVLNQEYQNVELIIVDDNSTDSTVNILNNITDPRVSIILSKKNNGAGYSRNIGIEKAKGRFIAFLDSDDIWIKSKLKEQISFMLTHDYPFTFSYYQHFSSKGLEQVITAPEYTTYQKSLYGNVIGCLTVIYDTQRFGKQYMPLIRKRQDFGLWLTLLSLEKKAYCYPKVLAYYRIDSGMTQNKFNAAKYQWQFYRHVMKFNPIKSSWYFSFYTINGFLKHSKLFKKIKHSI